MSEKIAREYVGHVEVVGRAHVFGVALDPRSGRVVYLDLFGAVSSVEAVWARLLRRGGQTVYLHRPMPHPYVTLQTDAEGSFVRYQRKLAGLDQDNLVLVREDDSQVGPDCYAYLLDADTAQARAGRVITCLQQFCRVAILNAWADDLLALGRSHNLVMSCVCYGGIRMLAVTRDADAWQRLICEALAAGQIHLPKED